jgi:hypothetical protein
MTPTPTDDDSVIDLPPLDGGADDEAPPEPEDFEGGDVLSGEGDLDDSTGESEPVPELDGADAKEQGSLLADAEESAALDVGGIDPIGDESESLLDGAEEPGTADESLDVDEAEETLRDAGEEGPTAESDEVGLEDLPPMDADEEGAGDEAAFFDELADEIVAPWADAAWEKFAEIELAGTATWASEMSSLGFAAAAVESASAKDALGAGMSTVRASTRVGTELACARPKPTLDASAIFLWSEEAGARTVAEVGSGDAFEVAALVWDEGRGVLWACGDFGVIGLKPPQKRQP